MTEKYIEVKHRVPHELGLRIRRLFLNPLTQRTQYGELGRVGETLWRDWVEKQEAARAIAPQPNAQNGVTESD